MYNCVYRKTSTVCWPWIFFDSQFKVLIPIGVPHDSPKDFPELTGLRFRLCRDSHTLQESTRNINNIIYN